MVSVRLHEGLVGADGVGTDLDEVRGSAGGLLNYREAALRVGVSQRTLWAAANRGELVTVRIGRRVLFDPRDLDDWVNRHKTSSPQSGKEGA